MGTRVALVKQLLAQVADNDSILESVLTAAKKRSVQVKDLEKLKADTLAGLIIDLFNATLTSSKLMKSGVEKIDMLRSTTLHKYDEQLEKMDTKLEELNGVVDKVNKAVAKVESNVDAVNNATKSLVEKESDVTNSLKTYAEATKTFVEGKSEVSKPTVSVEKNVLKQAWAESRQEEERLRSVIVSGIEASSTNTQDYEFLKDKVCDILKSIDLDHLTSQVENAHYIGKAYKKPDDYSVCLVRVTFTTRAAVGQFLRESKDLKDQRKFADIYINPDRSLPERKEMKKLVAEMKKRNDDDPSVFWRISKMKLISFKKTEKAVP